jgi:hypothetical protein
MKRKMGKQKERNLEGALLTRDTISIDIIILKIRRACCAVSADLTS